MAVEYGERLLWKTKPKNNMEKLNLRWHYGVFVGVRTESGEIWVANKDGVRAVRSVRRTAREDRWGPDNKAWVKHVPWNKEGEDPEADGDVPEDRRDGGRSAQPSEEVASGSGGPKVIVVNTRVAAPREFYIKKRDLDQHGHTGLPGVQIVDSRWCQAGSHT